MGVSIQTCGAEALDRYALVPAWFTTTTALRVEDPSSDALTLVEVPLERPYVKDYDAVEEEGGVAGWSTRFDTTEWGVLLAVEDGLPVGGAAIAIRTPGAIPLEHAPDQAVLWDLRVHPERRREGIGTLLFERATAWARGQGCVRLVIETQDVNVAACRFYERLGCGLLTFEPRAYASSRDPRVACEAMIIWTLRL